MEEKSRTIPLRVGTEAPNAEEETPRGKTGIRCSAAKTSATTTSLSCLGCTTSRGRVLCSALFQEARDPRHVAAVITALESACHHATSVRKPLAQIRRERLDLPVLRGSVEVGETTPVKPETAAQESEENERKDVKRGGQPQTRPLPVEQAVQRARNLETINQPLALS